MVSVREVRSITGERASAPAHVSHPECIEVSGQQERLGVYARVDGAMGASEPERRREFARQMQSLPRQQFYFLAKDHPALRCRTSDVPAPSAAAHRSDEGLLDVFARHLAPTSMIPVDVAARLIAEWEAEVLGQQQITENAPTPRPRGETVTGGLDELRKILNGGSGSGK